MRDVLDRLLERHPHHAVLLGHAVRNRVRGGGDRLVGLRGDLHAGARRVVLPAVIRTHDAAVLHLAERECGAAMDAEVLEDADARLGTEGDEVLIEQCEALRLLGYLLDGGDRVPKLREALGLRSGGHATRLVAFGSIGVRSATATGTERCRCVTSACTAEAIGCEGRII